MLSTQIFGDPASPPLLIAHGLYGSGRNWRAIAKALARRWRVVVVDMPNHGTSPRMSEMTYPAMADALAEAMDGTPMVVLGHSMGGKAAMLLALNRPDLVEGLIIGDIAPVAYRHAAENAGYANAMLALDLATLTDRRAADAALAGAIDDAGLRAFFLQSLEFGEGGARWQLNLPVIADAMEEIVGFPGVAGQYDGPVISLIGETSPYVTEAGRDATQRLFPEARFVTIRGAGHWLHADKPRAFIETMNTIMDRLSR